MKNAQVFWSDEALSDLEAIYDFVAETSQPAAQRIVESILSRSRQLEAFPESGAREQAIRSGKVEYRYLVEGNYKVIYSYQSELHTVHIALVFDTRFDPEKLIV